MDNFRLACVEILEEIKKSNPSNQRQLNQLKLKVLHRYSSLSQIPKNADIYFAASESERGKFKDLLSLKPVRTLSGVSPIALMSEPYPCPHTMKGIGPCTYCPGGPGSPFGSVPQSYTGKEPSTRRAIRNNYDPYLIVFNRLEHYVAMGRIPDKAELIIQGGTFTFFPRSYQEYFVKYALKAMNDFSKLFFDGNGELDMVRFKEFFKLPRLASREAERTKSMHSKLLHIKNLDLGNLEMKKDIGKLFFENELNNAPSEKGKFNSDEITVSEQELKPIGNGIKNANLLAINNIQNKLKTENNQNLSLKNIQKENETA
ncbi:hypothetical protein HY487_01815, partial [Candidatus Woesearchaeota archaeon]|nr:hypothetical protein [Candidatus Woesearchaeota archaeon]